MKPSPSAEISAKNGHGKIRGLVARVIKAVVVHTQIGPRHIDHAVIANNGGIDFNAANLNLQIKRDGRGVPLPLALQDMAQLNRIQGFEPEIIEIKPALNLPIISELQQKLQSSNA